MVCKIDILTRTIVTKREEQMFYERMVNKKVEIMAKFLTSEMIVYFHRPVQRLREVQIRRYVLNIRNDRTFVPSG